MRRAPGAVFDVKFERGISVTCDVKLDHIAETRPSNEARAESTRGMPTMPKLKPVLRLHAERGPDMPQVPQSKNSKKAGVKDDARRVAMAPFDRELPATDEMPSAHIARNRGTVNQP